MRSSSRTLLVAVRLRHLAAEALLLGAQPVEGRDRAAPRLVGGEHLVDQAGVLATGALGGPDGLGVLAQQLRVQHPASLTAGTVPVASQFGPAAIVVVSREGPPDAQRAVQPGVPRGASRTGSACSSKLLKVSLAGGNLMARQGTMVAYQGDIAFDYQSAGGIGKMLKKAGPVRAST